MANTDLHSSDLEIRILGSILSCTEAAHFAIGQLEAEDFHDEINQQVFMAMTKQYENSAEIDTGMLIAHFKTHKEDWSPYTTAINTSIGFSNTRKIEEYCGALQNLAFRRVLVKEADSLSAKARDLNTPQDTLYDGIDRAKEIQFRSTPDLARTSNQIKEDEANKEEAPQLNTGIPEWDKSFYKQGGLGVGTTELIFGRPGHGKTYYLFRKEAQLALRGHAGLHFHLEDTSLEASTRIDAIINPSNPRSDNILIIDQHRYLHDIIHDIRYYHHKFGIKWIGVDHMGRVKVRGYGAKYKNQAMIEVSNQLTDTCEKLGLHGMFTVQPRKIYGDRKGWQNLLREEDLKGASEIVEDAFVITTLLRPNMYPELRGGLAEQKYVKRKDGIEAPFDSVFFTQIKNRRQPLTNEFLHMIQHGDRLLFEREYKKYVEKQPEPITDEDCPF